MKQSRILFITLAALAASATLALAGGDNCSASQKASAGKGCCSGAASASAASAASTCPMHAGAKAASAGQCSMHGASAASAAGCPGMSGAAAAGKCDMTKMAAMHGNCAVCSDEAACDEEVRALNVHSQVVALRNGAMIVYTADTPEGVRALQAALARHNARIVNALSTSDDPLCGGCRSFRGAMASGKFSRELVNVKTGAQVLLTSSDRAIVRQIHDMTGAQVAARTKS